MKKLILAILPFIAFAFAACSTPGNSRPVAKGLGVYTPASPYYFTVGWVLHAKDASGAEYILERPQFDGGYVSGISASQSERWTRVSDGKRGFRRTLLTFDDPTVAPVFSL